MTIEHSAARRREDEVSSPHEAHTGARHDFDVCSRLQVSVRDTTVAEGALQFSRLAPFLRVLLVTDGTVTRSLEAYFNEPIEVEVLAHCELRSERSHPEIGIGPGDSMLKRRVALRGSSTRSVYAFAQSVVATAGIAPEVRHRLVEARKGIGELLAEGGFETYRKLTAITRSHANEWAVHLGVAKSDPVVARSYRIYQAGRATIAIDEVFPEARFAR